MNINISIRGLILPGILASIVMGMVTMTYEGLFGVGFWAPVVFISGVILRSLQDVSIPVQFQLGPVVLGLMGHMMNSVVVGVVFALLVAPKLKETASLILGGVVYSLIIFVVMWYIILPLINPVMLHLNPFVFAFSHMMLGVTLGVVAVRRRLIL